jgi:hypothetical protein
MSKPNNPNKSGDGEPVGRATDLERVEVKPRASRGAVVSVRLTSEEAQAVASRAEKTGVSVSEYARRTLRRSLATGWRLMVWDGTGPLVVGLPPQTGGEYGRFSGITSGEAAG